MSEHSAPADGDFLDGGVGEPEADGHGELPPYGVPAPVRGGPAGWKAALRPTAWVAAGVVAGAVAVAAWHSSQTTTAAPNANPAAQGPLGQNGGPPGFGGQNGGPGFGQVPGYGGGQGFGGQGFGGGQRFGGRPGEQHVSGTVTAVGGSSVTVKLASGGTATYTVLATSDIVKNGARVPLSAIKVGDAVFLHVYPQSGRTVVEHLFAGARPDGAAPAGPSGRV